MKVTILTLGCRVNQSESYDLEGSLKENGVTIVDLKDNPDYCIINTCTVTSKSDYNSRQLIRRAVKAGSQVIVTGCYSQLKPEDIKGIHGVSQIIDIKKKQEILKIITGRPLEFNYGEYSNSRPYLKVQDGCNLNCSYCAVPLARGRAESIPLESVIEKARKIVSQGFNEIVLTGIHLGSYGKDLHSKTNLNNLLKEMLKLTDIKRIRLSSIEINEINDELIELLKETRICNHLHLPMQSGSNLILRQMNRHYTAEKFIKVVEDVAKRIENISIGTDIIVGFPGEGDAEFKESLEMLKNLPFSYMHIFPFSPRPQTNAYYFNNRISNNTIKQRISVLKEIKAIKKRDYMSKQISLLLDIIVEDRIDNYYITGTSANYLKVRVPLKDYPRGSIVIVRPTKVIEDMIEGILIQNP